MSLFVTVSVLNLIYSGAQLPEGLVTEECLYTLVR